MSGRSKASESRWLLSVVKVDNRHRLVLPSGISEVVGWIGDGGVDCRAYVAVGGVGVVPAALDQLHGKLAAALTERRLELDEAAMELGDVVRFVASSWPMSIDRQLRLTLPEDARKLGLVPGAGQHAAVFASGEVLEIWPAATWREHVGRLTRAAPRFITDIEDR